MGLMRFVVTPPQCITPETAQQAYLSDTERTVWQIQTEMADGELVLSRSVGDSGSLHVPWPVAGHNRLVLSTGHLMEQQATPYQLPLELARGTVNQLHDQIADWQSIGLAVPESILAKASEATRSLCAAAVTQSDRSASATSAQRAIRLALDAAGELAGTYVEQVLAARRRSAAKLSTLLAGELGVSLLDDSTARQFLLAFNSAVVPLLWCKIGAREGSRNWTVPDRQVEWCKTQRLKLIGGPLLRLDAGGIPDWLYLWENDFESLLSFASEFVTATVTRYRGKVNMWQAAGRANTAEILSLSEEENIRLTLRAVELTRSLDPDTPVVISVDQPWAEYMSRREVDFPPLHFADTLVRSGLDISGMVLEINLGYHPGGTLPRTPLEFSRQLDRWSLLGLPLFVSLTVPSGHHDDPQARLGAKPSDGSTLKSQQAWIAQYVPLILAKSYVAGIIWNQLCDNTPHDFANGGLFDHSSRPKPAIKTLAALRRAYLK